MMNKVTSGGNKEDNNQPGSSPLCLKHGWKLTKATDIDLVSLENILTESRNSTQEYLSAVLSIEQGAPSAQREELKTFLAGRANAFFFANRESSEPTAALRCSYLEGAPPVYRPGRPLLSFQAFHDSAADIHQIGPALLDEAIRWATSLAQGRSVFVVGITWNHDKSLRRLVRTFHQVSSLKHDPTYRSLFEVDGASAQMKPATNWYFEQADRIKSGLGQVRGGNNSVRQATENDIPEMVELSRMKRHDYARYQPIFWRPAEDAEEKQRGFFASLLKDPNNILLVSQSETGTLNGFLIGMPRERLPMIDPAVRLHDGLHIDDFTVRTDDLWASVGHALLATAVDEHARRKGPKAGINVITGAHDQSKRDLLQHRAGMQSLFTWDILPSGVLYTKLEG